jgi:dienelactone hydrolase
MLRSPEPSPTINGSFPRKRSPRERAIVDSDSREFPPEQAALLASAFKDAGVDHLVEIWDGAAHGWTMRDFPVYNEPAAERHFHELVALFQETLLSRGLR